MKHDPTLAAFQRLLAFASKEGATLLDRLTTGNAAAWLAHATSYGITADILLLQEIADPEKNPVVRATTLTRGLISDITAAGFPLSTPFHTVDILYSALEDDEISMLKLEPEDPFENEVERGPRP